MVIWLAWCLVLQARFERPVNAVLHDYVQGLITLEGARLDYGVVITDGEVDIATTDAVRATQNIIA